jgi:hypothetical protein
MNRKKFKVAIATGILAAIGESAIAQRPPHGIEDVRLARQARDSSAVEA